MEKRREERGKRNPEEANLESDVLVGQADGSKGEHPVHANDIPEVQRAVFRGYQPLRALPDERVTHERANAVERKGVCIHARAHVSVATHTRAPSISISARVRSLRTRGVFVRRESLALFATSLFLFFICKLCLSLYTSVESSKITEEVTVDDDLTLRSVSRSIECNRSLQRGIECQNFRNLLR